MKALIRNNGETILETDGIKCVEWTSGRPLTDADWCEGPYTLVQNYVPPVNDEPALYEEVVVEDPEPIPQEENDDYVTINGVRYTKAELRSLIE